MIDLMGRCKHHVCILVIFCTCFWSVYGENVRIYLANFDSYGHKGAHCLL